MLKLFLKKCSTLITGIQRLQLFTLKGQLSLILSYSEKFSPIVTCNGQLSEIIQVNMYMSSVVVLI